MVKERALTQEKISTIEVLKVPPVRVVFEEEDRRRILREIDEVLVSGMVAAATKVKAFEEFWADYVGCKHAIACSNGGAALAPSSAAATDAPPVTAGIALSNCS